MAVSVMRAFSSNRPEASSVSSILFAVLAAAVAVVGLVVLDIWPTADSSGRGKKPVKAEPDPRADAAKGRRAAGFGKR